jgi:hypothetical protein
MNHAYAAREVTASPPRYDQWRLKQPVTDATKGGRSQKKTAAISIRPEMISGKRNVNHFSQLTQTPGRRRPVQNDTKITRFRKRLFFMCALWGKG